MESPFKFYVYEDSAYIYDQNQKRIFQMGVKESSDVEVDVEALILESGEEVSKEKAWEVSGLDTLG
ncbi:hypothetical protein SAMN05660337_2513 [Maridesulfovibrio ferrireducens]|uniref:Uncharacterized protein n=1 Tax=Maridesulfovibrio ferrireducens TaxID=246191 RepID=A0A1G9IAX1_9BACT|nr:hypothetical protein [Maridesulfovibrio ferrireducens]SDL22351.1 hypothetical protein SAMN05660337_2513 [Maridesulfovibrio ferrireducens]